VHDRPTAAELIAAARDYLTGELLPTVTDQRLRFRGLVAANVLAIVERELATLEADLLAEWAGLTALLDRPATKPPPRLTALRAEVEALNRDLGARIRAGEADAGPFRAAALAHARAQVEAKLRVANPRFLERARRDT